MSADEPDLLDVLEEIERGPLPCPHSVNMKTGGYVQQLDPTKPYYAEWVHAHPHCRRSKFPGHKQPVPDRRWSKILQKDVPWPLELPDEPVKNAKPKPKRKPGKRG